MRFAAEFIVHLVVISALLLGGCGFHLRGAATGETFSVHLVDQARLTTTGNWLGGGPGELTRVMTDAFASAGIPTDDTAPLRVDLLSESIEKRVASVDASAGAAEYQIDYTLQFRVLADDGATLVGKTNLKTDRSYRYKADAIMGSAEEEALLQREMRRDVALQILRQLRYAKSAMASKPSVALPVAVPLVMPGTAPVAVPAEATSHAPQR